MSLNGTVRICERMCKGIQKTWLTGFIISIVGHQVDILIRFLISCFTYKRSLKSN